MSYAYTPGLVVSDGTSVRVMRRLPVSGEILVRLGDQVSFDTIVAQTELAGNPHLVNVATTLEVLPEDMPQYMTKKVGDQVREGEVIARFTSLFGIIKRHCYAPRTGTLASLSSLTGQAMIVEPPMKVQLSAYIPGRVANIVPSEGVEIETPAAYIQGIFGIGGESHGQLMLLAKLPSDEVSAAMIGQECRGKILVGGSSIDLAALRRAVDVGAKGIVVGGIADKDFIDFLSYDIGVAITGQEKIGLTLILTEGFGRISMAYKTFALLKAFAGHEAAINGATQIRAGVVRPEIVVPLEALEKAEESRWMNRGLEPGMPVRVIREPYFGALGRIESLPTEPRMVGTESMVLVAEVRLADKRKVIVPRANVEIIDWVTEPITDTS